MKILVGHEKSGRVRDCFRALGHDAVSCDLKPSDRPGPHIQGDVIDAIRAEKWDMGIFFPDCTFLTVSGLHWNGRIEGRADKTEQAIEHVRLLMDCPIPKKSIENPVGCISTRLKKPSQTFHPWQFGEDASKKTCLWLFNLPKLLINRALYIPPRIVQGGVYEGKQRWSNQTDSGQNKLAPSDDRAELRSITPWGLALAMANQWGREQ